MASTPGGGETRESPSGWTVDTLHALLEAATLSGLTVHDRDIAALRAVVDERDHRYEQRFAAQQEAVQLALARVDKEFHEHLESVREETRAALEAADKAIGKSESATEKRFESVNEFRAQLADQASRFMPRTESLQRHEQTTDKLDALDLRLREETGRINSRLDLTAGNAAGSDRSRAVIAWGIAAMAGLVSIVVAANAYLGK